MPLSHATSSRRAKNSSHNVVESVDYSVFDNIIDRYSIYVVAISLSPRSIGYRNIHENVELNKTAVNCPRPLP